MQGEANATLRRVDLRALLIELSAPRLEDVLRAESVIRDGFTARASRIGRYDDTSPVDATQRDLTEQSGMLVAEYVVQDSLVVWSVVAGLELRYFGKHAWWIWEGRPVRRAVVARA